MKNYRAWIMGFLAGACLLVLVGASSPYSQRLYESLLAETTGATGTTYYGILDLSAQPHSGGVLLKRIDGAWTLSAAGAWQLDYGVITQTGTTSGTAKAEYFWHQEIIAAAAGGGNFSPEWPAPGIELTVGDTAMSYVTTGTYTTNDAYLSGATVAFPSGDAKAAVGDIVVVATEVSGSATFKFATGLVYESY